MADRISEDDIKAIVEAISKYATISIYLTIDSNTNDVLMHCAERIRQGLVDIAESISSQND